ncbi:MAG: hypothetical protein ABUS56_02140 [Acidobacteriota bacterium]
MSPRPRRLSWFVSAWLVCQLVGLPVSPLVLCASAVAEVSPVTCTCTHADGQACPMHHPAPRSAGDCACSSAEGTLAPAFVFAAAAVMPPPACPSPVLTLSGDVKRPVVHAVRRARVPDSPPPRA